MYLNMVSGRRYQGQEFIFGNLFEKPSCFLPTINPMLHELIIELSSYLVQLLLEFWRLDVLLAYSHRQPEPKRKRAEPASVS